MWTIIWVSEPKWHDRAEVMHAGMEVATRGTAAEWESFLRAAIKYGYLTDRPSVDEFIRRQVG